MLPDILETARLQLRPFRLQDVDDVLIYATDPEWARYLPVPQPYTPADAETFIAGQVLLDREVHLERGSLKRIGIAYASEHL